MPAKPEAFTFVPVVHKLPIKIIFAKDERSTALKGISDEDIAVSQERTTRDNMSDEDLFKAEIVFIKDVLDGERNTVQLQASTKFNPSPDLESLSQTKAPIPVSALSENTPDHEPTAMVSMETVVDKRTGSPWRQCHDISGHSEHSSGFFANTLSMSEDRASARNSPDFFPTLSSSRESILSDGLDKEQGWYGMRPSSVVSPASISRTVSQCSSVRSGVFSPAVVQIRRHFLAPTSSLIHTPQTCFSSCDSLSSSTCPQTPTPRHRPPLTRLSLLTAILRKGRLHVLSAAMQRPYTPCWPVNPVTLSVCKACSAACSVASIPLEFSSQFSSSTTVDSQNPFCSEPSRALSAPLIPESSKNHINCLQTHLANSQLRKTNRQNSYPRPMTPRETPPPLFQNLSLISETHPEKIAKADTTDIFISKLHEQRQGLFLKDPMNKTYKKRSPPSTTSMKKPETSVLRKWTCQPNSSLSRLQMLSQQLRSPPVSPSHLPPSPPHISPLNKDSSLPHLQQISKVGGHESEGSGPVSRTSTPSQACQKAHSLPFCYTTLAFPGWSSPIRTPTSTPSPAPPIKDLTSSPSLSLCSTPSPRPGSGISDFSDVEGKKRKPHKIKSSYKSLAAIPTNTILLDQQGIDEQVERELNDCNTIDRLDTHAEMYSPAELRQKSADLYTVIDEILANSSPPKTSKVLTANECFQHNPSFGRETKYASLCSLHPSANKERQLRDIEKTKPGVIRPMTAISRLTEEVGDHFKSISLRKLFEQAKPNKNKWQINMWLEKGKLKLAQIARLITLIATVYQKMEKITPEVRTDSFMGSKGKLVEDKAVAERKAQFTDCELQIKEPDELLSLPGKEAGSSFGTSDRNMEVFEVCM